MTSTFGRKAIRGAAVALASAIALSMSVAISGPTAVAAPSGPAGDIVDHTDITHRPDSRPRGIDRAYSVRYRSPNAAGELVPVLGTVLIPAGAAPAGGRPILAFNHGTTGLGADCAESAGLGGPNGYHEWLAPWIERGYVIVATEYAGIGTDGAHAYLDAGTTGRNVLDMVRASRTLLDGLGEPLADDFVASGGSQGGHASLSAASLVETYAPELHLKAVVASAPPVRIDSYLALLGPLTPPAPVPDYVTYLSYILAGLEVSSPDLDVSGYLTPIGRKIVDDARTLCYGAQNSNSEGVSVGQVLSRPLAEGRLIDAVRAKLAVPEKGYGAPILVQQGVFDPTAFGPLTSGFVDSVRASGARVDLRLYPKTHVLGAQTQVDAAVWVDARG
jgi:Secretory lipase